MNSRQLAQNWKYPRHSGFEETLRDSASKWFADNNFPVHSKMPYCLDKLENWKRNIILSEVSDYIDKIIIEKEEKKKPFPLHKYAHHGLSSQAMVFNLVGPLIVRNDYYPIIEVFKKKGIEIIDNIHAEFEYEDRLVFNEDTGQPTSIDLILINENHQPFIFIESKLVETEFGGCSVFTKGDCNGKNPINEKSSCFLHFIGRRYWELLDKYGFSDILKNEKICILVNYYQFFREILFSIEKNGIFTLLYDERSPVFNFNGNRGLIPLLRNFVPAQHQDKIIMISIQEVVESICISKMHTDWINKFKDKYALK